MAGATKTAKKPAKARPGLGKYRLEDQIGFVIRKASQRHAAIFAKSMVEELTPTQWAALVKVAEAGAVSQNQLGRDTAMDVATIKGVVDRLVKRGLVSAGTDPHDSRRSVIGLTAEGGQVIAAGLPVAEAITAETLGDLTAKEQNMLIRLLRRIG